MLDNVAMIIAGTVVGAAGTLLTQLMAKAMNRSLGNVLFANFGETSAAAAARPGRKSPSTRGRRRHDGLRAESHRRSGLRPGGRAGAAQGLGADASCYRNGVKVKFAIHPVAGRMPGT